MTQAQIDRRAWLARETYISKIMSHMKWDRTRSLIWLRTPSPFLGGVSPEAMVHTGRAFKVEKLIDNLIDENTPDTRPKRPIMGTIKT